MDGRVVKVLVFISFISWVHTAQNTATVSPKKVIGIETSYPDGVKIDKDTIITKNMKLMQKTRIVNAAHNKGGDPNLAADDIESIPSELNSEIQAFRRNMTECLKEVGRNDKRKVKSLSPYKDSPIHGECLIACVLKRNGVLVNGKVDKGNFSALLRKFYARDTELMKKMETSLDKCVERNMKVKDDCALASKLNDCISILTNDKNKIVVNL